MLVRFTGESDPLGLIKGKEYDVLSIEHGDYRLIDETGEDYLYSPAFFEIVSANAPAIAAR